jgi:hypothetical protein
MRARPAMIFACSMRQIAAIVAWVSGAVTAPD